MRNRSFVKEKRIRNAWEWLEDPADSATTAYLKWENDYYDQYFYPQQDELEDVSAQFSRQAQGMPPRTASSVTIDTVFRRINGQLGFYRVVPDKDATLLIAAGPVTAGYIITDYGWNNDVQYYYAEEQSRTYDRALKVYNAKGLVTERSSVDDYLWRKDTLYLTGYNELLRTATFSRWTKANGWEELLEEQDPIFEYRMETSPTGQLILLSESLRTAYTHQQIDGVWRKDPVSFPALYGGTGMRGRGCEAEVGADYISDCQETELGTCVIAVKSARHQLWLQPSGRSEWQQIPLPAGQHHASFGKGKDGEVVIELEGVSTYGQSYTVDFANRSLKFITTEYPVINLPGYRGSHPGTPFGPGRNKRVERMLFLLARR